MRLFSLFYLMFLAGLPVAAQDNAPENPAFQKITARAIEAFVLPGYERLGQEAELTGFEMGDLCGSPSAEALATTRRQFAALLDAWARVELIGFGPVAENNRFERLNFWPDRKSIGLRQIRRALKARNPDLTDPDKLVRKSVGLQGMSALEYVLFGTGAETLTGQAGSHRCAYGRAAVTAIHRIALVVGNAWSGDTGFANTMRRPGPDNHTYRDHSEATQAFMLAVASQLIGVRGIKLLPALGESAGKSRPKRAPFWRSGLTLRYLAVNIEAAHQLFEVAGFMDALPKSDKWLEGSIAFKIGAALRHLRQVKGEFAQALLDNDRRRLLKQAAININGAARAIGDYYAGRADLTLGFNSKDGD